MAVQSVFLRGEIYMRKTTTRMLALVLSTVMTVSGFAGFGGESKAYAAEAAQTVIADSDEENATPGDATPTDTRIDASNFSVALSNKTFTYDGKVKNPDVTIKDTEGKYLDAFDDYNLEYINNQYVGTATVKITYKGKYKGSRTINYKIVKKKISNISFKQTAGSMSIRWSKISGATGYSVLKLVNGKWIEFYTGKTASTTIKNLKANTEYKFRIQAYVEKNGKKIILADGEDNNFTNPPKVTGGTGGIVDKSNKNLVVSNRDTSVILGFDKISGIDEYIIYKYNTKTRKWQVCNNAFEYTPSKSQREKNKVYYEVCGLAPGTSYMFKVAAHKFNYMTPVRIKEYWGEKSDTIKSATAPKAQVGCDRCYIYKYSGNWEKEIGMTYKIELRGVSKNKGYYISLVKYSGGKAKIVKTIKTNKTVCEITLPKNYSNVSYGIQARPYCVYGGKTYVSYTVSGSTITTKLGKLAEKADDYYIRIHKSKSGKISSYEVVSSKLKKQASNVYVAVKTTTKYYDTKWRYKGKTVSLRDKYFTTYSYNSKNKLVSYTKNVYAKDGKSCIGINVYNSQGKIIRRIRF